MKSKIRTQTGQWISYAILLSCIPATSFAAAPTKPGTPTGTITNSTVNLSWTASTDDNKVAGYNVYINNAYTTTVSTPQYAGTVSATAPSEFYIVAFDEPLPTENRAFSPRSTTVTLTPTTGGGGGSDSPIPTPATALTATRTTATTANLTWTAATDDKGVAGYNVYRDNQYLTTVKGTSYTDTTLTAGTAHNYYLVTFDESRNFSSRSTAVVIAASVGGGGGGGGNTDPIPTAATALKATRTAATTATITWTASTDDIGIAGYNVYRDGQYLTTVQSTSYNDTTLTANTAHSYYVVAFDLDQTRKFSKKSTIVSVETTVDGIDRGNPPTLPNPYALPIPGPSYTDPFNTLLEVDDEEPTAGGPPTQPKNLRAELVSNDWAEINWAPSNDDGEVVEYRIYRSDGHTYTVRADQVSSSSGTQDEIDKYWRSTTFIDCNYTRFPSNLHNCDTFGPQPGDDFSYEVSAVDDEGQESARSESINIVYHLDENAPIPYYDDPYKSPADRFVQAHDLSQTRYYLDKYTQVFEEEFTGTEIDSTKWNTQLTWGDSHIINGEQQYFVNTQRDPDFGYDPFKLTGDTLIIEAIPTPEEAVENLPPKCAELSKNGSEQCLFLSGALSSHDKFGLTYGYVESRMKVGGKSGMLSSFYLYHRYPGQGIQRHSPEIDIIEYLGENRDGDEDAFQTYHYSSPTDEPRFIDSAPTMSYANPTGELYSDDFHTYGVLWEPQLVIWYIDGREVKRLTGVQVSRQQMNIVTYLVTGSGWAPTPDLEDPSLYPMQLEIDYIRAYQREAFIK